VRHEREEAAGRPEALVLLLFDDVRLALAGLGVDDGQVDVGGGPAERDEGADKLCAGCAARVQNDDGTELRSSARRDCAREPLRARLEQPCRPVVRVERERLLAPPLESA
jgi:hypothetical protein